MKSPDKVISLSTIHLERGESVHFNLIKENETKRTYVRVGNICTEPLRIVEFYIDNRLVDTVKDIEKYKSKELNHVRLLGVKELKFKVTYHNGHTTDVIITKQALKGIKAALRK